MVELECFGETTGHYPLNGIIAGNKDRLIACVGCIHAGESGPELILPAVRQLLERSPSLLEQVGIAALVSVNADQRERLAQGVPWYLRVNGNAVDLNRNFDALWDEIEYSYNFSTQWEYSPTYRGPFPESELEVLAVKIFITNTSPKAIFSYHALASVTEDRMLVAKECEEDRNFSEKCLRYMGAYSKAFRSFADSELTFDKPCIIYKATAGSLPSWAYHLGIPCFDLEYAGSAELKPSINGDTTEEMVKRCSQRHKEGLVAVIKEFLKEPL